MPGGSRSLPGQPSLRHLKLEAKRRLAAGEFPRPARRPGRHRPGVWPSHAGANLAATAAVTTRIRDQRTHVVLTSRLIPVNSIESRLLRTWTSP